jgi:NTE family protein
MVPGRVSRGPAPRTALVLGAGGVLGAAWMTGALPAVAQRLGRPVNEVDIIVGTSAGSVLAAALRCGVTVEEMIAHQRGEATGPLAASAVADLTTGPWPPMPQWRVGSPRLLLASLLTPHRVHPWVGASAWLPLGRGNHLPLRDMIDTLHRHAYRHTAPEPPPEWVDGHTWIVTVDYDSGRRVVFGRPGSPTARLPEAVAASCSIPGWYAPVMIGGHRYVDGGVRSATSLGLLARAGVEEVHVLAPMASIVTDRPRGPYERLERRFRSLITLALLREVRALRQRGIQVHVVTPGPEDLTAMGANLMDVRRREAVLETSLRTSALRATPRGGGAPEPEAA